MGLKTEILNLLKRELLKKLEEARKTVETLLNIISKYDLDDPEILTDIYSITRFTFLRVIETVYRITTSNSRLFLLRDVLEDVILPFGNSYSLDENFTITAILYNYKTVMLLEAEDINGEISFSIKEVSTSYEKFYKVLKNIKEAFKNATDVTDYTPPANIM